MGCYESCCNVPRQVNGNRVMGFSSGFACHPTKVAALADWCVHVEPGSTAMSCQNCVEAGSTCRITYTPSNSAVSVTRITPVFTPDCTVPTPAADAAIYSSAVIALWITVWAASQLYKFFNTSHAD